MGEFGFLTADDVYHITVYATDEDGNYKVISMKNIKLSQCKLLWILKTWTSHYSNTFIFSNTNDNYYYHHYNNDNNTEANNNFNNTSTIYGYFNNTQGIEYSGMLIV